MKNHNTVLGYRTKSSLSGADGMRLSRRILTGLFGLITTVVMVSGGQGAGAKDANIVSPLGADISRLIIASLADQGLEGTPEIDDDRVFPVCDSTPEIEPMFGGWNTVAVRCTGETVWRFAIRTNLNSRPAPVPVRDFRPDQSATGPIERVVARSVNPRAGMEEVEVVALARSVSRNDIIADSDLVMIAIPARNVIGAFLEPTGIVGRRMKTSLSAHKPLMVRHLHPDYLVEEGQEVLISSSAGGISVDMIGYALENGQFGEWIGVENAGSGKTVRAKIVGEKKVRVIAKK